MIRKLALTSLRGNVTFTASGATAWFVIPGVRWAFRADTDRDQTIADAAQRFAALTGRRIHMRVTSRPWSAAGWRAAMQETAIAPLPAWSAHLDAEAAHLERLSLADKFTYLGVDLDRPLAGAARLLGKKHEDAKLLEQTDEITRIVSAAGLACTPATQAEVEWLIRRSVALGCPPPEDVPSFRSSWDADDIAEFTGSATWTVEPFGRTVKVTADIPTVTVAPQEIPELASIPEAEDSRWALAEAHNDLLQVDLDVGLATQRVVRYVCVLTVGRMAELDSASPWLSKTDRLGFPVEISVTANVLEAKSVTKDVQSSILRVRAQLEHFAEHHQPPPHSLPQAQERALSIQDEVERGMTGLSTRCDVWIRLLVWGATEAEVLARAGKLIDLYSPSVTVAHTSDQYNLAREMIPGEPLSTTAYRRRMPVTTLAGSMPQVTHHVGNDIGSYVGFTSQGSARNPVFLDQWHSMEKDKRSGLTIVAGIPGSGKSALVGSMAVRAALAGVRSIVLDPSGPLARLTELPELKAVSKNLDLLASRPGTLNPFQVIAEPRLEHYASREEWEHACAMANGQRRRLCCDILMQLLSPKMADKVETDIALRRATRIVGGHTTSTPRQVIAALRNEKDRAERRHATDVAESLADIADTAAGALIFSYGTEVDAAPWVDALLTVITMNGVQLPPPGTPRVEWTQEQQMGVPLLSLAAWLTQRIIYESRSMESRKFLAMDEAWSLTRVESGRMLLNMCARDSRKWNTRFWLASQNVSDLASSDVSNLFDSAFVGRTESLDAQVAALKLLRIPTDVGFESVLGTLGSAHSKEMVYADGAGAVERITIDQGGLSDAVRSALDTSPSGVPAKTATLAAA